MVVNRSAACSDEPLAVDVAVAAAALRRQSCVDSLRRPP